jgi:hypothetical protein
MTFEEFKDLYIEEFGERYNCKICDFKMTKFHIKKHMKRCHCTCKPYFCELCSEGFKKVEDRTKHLAEKHPNQFKCEECNIQFYMSLNYVDHIQFFHKQSIYLKTLKPRAEIDIPIERLRFVPEIFDREVSQAQSHITPDTDISLTFRIQWRSSRLKSPSITSPMTHR